jgi:hypothetical protein
MDYLTICIQNYPVLEALCEHIGVSELSSLALLNSTARGAIRGAPSSAPPPTTTLKDGVIVHERCACSRDADTPCSLHGSKTWRNLLTKLRHTCQDPSHQDIPDHDDDGTSNLWTSTVMSALGVDLYIDSCRRCNLPVCFTCWWRRAVSESINMRGNGRAKQVCHGCWTAPRKDASTGEKIPSLEENYQQNDFCSCGPTPLCSPCANDFRSKYVCPFQSPYPLYTDPLALSLGTNAGLGVTDERYYHPWQLQCSICDVFLHSSDYFLTRYMCHFCKLPMRMRPNDHALQKNHLATPDPRRSFAPAKERGDAFSRGVVSPSSSSSYIEAPPASDAHYEDREEYWKATSRAWVWLYLTTGTPKTHLLQHTPPRPPTNPLPLSDSMKAQYWRLYERLYARRNHPHYFCFRLSFGPKLASFERHCAYFMPIERPVWDFEEALF